MSLSGINFRTRISKRHASERRHSPLFLGVQNWENLPYHFGLQEETIFQRRNVEKCPRGLEQLMQIKEVSIEKLSKNRSTRFLFCKKSCNNSWHILFASSEGKKQQLLFHAEKSPSHSRVSTCIGNSIEFGIYHPHPTKESKQQLAEKTAILHCSGYSTNELVIDYVIQMPGESKSLSIPLGTIYQHNLSSCKSTMITHYGQPTFNSAFKVCKQSSQLQQPTRNLKKLHHIVRCVDDKTVGRLYKNSCSTAEQTDKLKECNHNNQNQGKNEDKWTLEFSNDLEPIAKALVICTSLNVIDRN